MSSGSQFYRWLIKEGFPSGYRVLCFNCNNAKSLYGRCPHEKKLVTVDLDEKPASAMVSEPKKVSVTGKVDLDPIERASQEMNSLF